SRQGPEGALGGHFLAQPGLRVRWRSRDAAQSCYPNLRENTRSQVATMSAPPGALSVSQGPVGPEKAKPGLPADLDPAEIAAELEPLSAHEVIAWTLEHFHPAL